MNNHSPEWTTITCDTSDIRLDIYLSQITGLSRTRIQKLIDDNCVTCNGKNVKANLKLQASDCISYSIPPAQEIALKPQDIPIEILYQDEDIAIVNKPAGLVVHPGAGNWEGTLVNALLHHFGDDLAKSKGIGGEIRPGIVHRIDKNTSGILLITKSDLAHQNMSAQFKTHSITRRYQGLCWGKLPLSGEWTGSIARDPNDRKRMAIVDSGRNAKTQFRNLKTLAGPVSHFEANLLTGRTHQIRVHFSYGGYSLVGDTTYQKIPGQNNKPRDHALRELKNHQAHSLIQGLELLDRQCLHACHLGFTHPRTGKEMQFNTQLPNDIQNLLAILG